MADLPAMQGFDWLIAGVGVLTHATPNCWPHFNPWKDIIMFTSHGSCPETNELKKPTNTRVWLTQSWQK